MYGKKSYFKNPLIRQENRTILEPRYEKTDIKL